MELQTSNEVGTANDGNPLLAEVFQSDYNDLSAIGSVHWYRTIIANAKHCAEYIDRNQSGMMISEYSKIMKKCFEDLIKAQEMGIITTSKEVAQNFR